MNKKEFKFILSANYFERKSKKKWLLRKSDENEPYVEQLYAVTATNVVFGPSRSIEEWGFGCTIVAFCEVATGHRELPAFDKNQFFPLRFDGGTHFRDENGIIVTEVAALYLGEDGRMWFQPVGQPVSVKESKEVEESVEV